MTYKFTTKQSEREQFIKLCQNNKFIEAHAIYKKICKENIADDESMLGISILSTKDNRLMQVCLLNIDR